MVTALAGLADRRRDHLDDPEAERDFGSLLNCGTAEAGSRRLAQPHRLVGKRRPPITTIIGCSWSFDAKEVGNGGSPRAAEEANGRNQGTPHALGQPAMALQATRRGADHSRPPVLPNSGCDHVRPGQHDVDDELVASQRPNVGALAWPFSVPSDPAAFGLRPRWPCSRVCEITTSVGVRPRASWPTVEGYEGRLARAAAIAADSRRHSSGATKPAA